MADREALVSCCPEVGVPPFSNWLMIIVLREDPRLVLNYVARNNLQLLMPLSWVLMSAPITPSLDCTGDGT